MANYTEKELANAPAEELMEIIMELQDDLVNVTDQLHQSQKEAAAAEELSDRLQSQLDTAIIDPVTVDLGTLQYKFEKGNLQLVQKFEHFLQNELNTVTHAEIFK